MNTAVLTGRQVSQPLKIFIVSEAGSVADVTLHTSCQTSDDSALKVSERMIDIVRGQRDQITRIAKNLVLARGLENISCIYRVSQKKVD